MLEVGCYIKKYTNWLEQNVHIHNYKTWKTMDLHILYCNRDVFRKCVVHMGIKTLQQSANSYNKNGKNQTI